MIKPDIPENEADRLRSLRSYSILDSLPESDYDNITKLASQICKTPISLISLVDENRQWFKSRQGLDASETPRNDAFCAHAINKPNEVLVVNDAREDKRFIGNPLVDNKPPVIFYAGVPLTTDKGHSLGTLCVIDHKPNSLTKEQLEALESLSNQVMRLFELRKKASDLQESLDALNAKNSQLDRFASVAAHDLKSPLNNISGFVELLKEQYHNVLDNKGREMLKYIDQSASSLKAMVDGLLKHSRSVSLSKDDITTFSIGELEQKLNSVFVNHRKDFKLEFESELEEITAHRIALEQILMNLVSNALKYNDKEVAQIKVLIEKTDSQFYRFKVIDNGMGIAPEHHDKVFEMFETLHQEDRYGNTGTGIGLATVKSMVERLGGEINLESKLGEGSTFTFTLTR